MNKSLLDVVNALDRQCSFSLDAVMPDHGASVHILDGVAPLLKSLTPYHTFLRTAINSISFQ